MQENKLLSYYQKELSYLKTYGQAFARKYPKVARRLGMSEGLSEDPHVERIIESFALLTAQIQQRIDDDMPEVTEALLNAIAPQLIRQFPSVCIVQMQAESKTSGITAKNEIPAKTELFSQQVQGETCRFRTVYQVDLQPLELSQTRLVFIDSDHVWRLQLGFTVWPGASVSEGKLRLFLNGADPAVNILYTLMCSQVTSFSLQQNEVCHSLSPMDIQPVGFGENEGLIKQDSLISPAHALLQDYFFFPQKFHFIDLPLPANFSAGSNSQFTYTLEFSRCALVRRLENIASIVDKSFFRLHCTPAINLFEHRAEAITPHRGQAEYLVVPDIRHQDTMEVWSVNQVQALRKEDNELRSRHIYPLFGLDHSRSDGENGLYWQCFLREDKKGKSDKRELFIAFSDLGANPLNPSCDLVSLHLTCTNRDLPLRILNGHPDGDFGSELPLSGVKIQALTRPSHPVRPPLPQAARWRLISQLSLNHTLMSGPEGGRVLRETLALYNFNNNPSNTRLINLINNVDVLPITARMTASDPRSMARGIEISINFVVQAANEPEHYLLCRFLDNFLALYAPVNSFSRVVTAIETFPETRCVWPIRTGRLAWI